MINKLKSTSLYIKLRSLYLSKEEKELETKRNKFYSQFIKKGDIVFDVGANIGNRVKSFLNLQAQVIAIEPQSFCRKVLKAKFGNKITIIKEGLGEKEEIKTMFISNSNTLSSFSEEWINAVKTERFKNENWNKTETIQLTTLDKIIAAHGKPVLIKIDVEGFELEVLKGLHQPVRAISFEYTVPEQLSKAIDCVNYINSLSPKYYFNYSLGETMQMQLNDFLNHNEFLKTLSSDLFLKFNNGDIYALLKE